MDGACRPARAGERAGRRRQGRSPASRRRPGFEAAHPAATARVRQHAAAERRYGAGVVDVELRPTRDPLVAGRVVPLRPERRNRLVPEADAAVRPRGLVLVPLPAAVDHEGAPARALVRPRIRVVDDERVDRPGARVVGGIAQADVALEMAVEPAPMVVGLTRRHRRRVPRVGEGPDAPDPPVGRVVVAGAGEEAAAVHAARVGTPFEYWAQLCQRLPQKPLSTTGFAPQPPLPDRTSSKISQPQRPVKFVEAGEPPSGTVTSCSDAAAESSSAVETPAAAISSEVASQKPSVPVHVSAPGGSSTRSCVDVQAPEVAVEAAVGRAVDVEPDRVRAVPGGPDGPLPALLASILLAHQL